MPAWSMMVQRPRHNRYGRVVLKLGETTILCEGHTVLHHEYGKLITLWDPSNFHALACVLKPLLRYDDVYFVNAEGQLDHCNGNEQDPGKPAGAYVLEVIAEVCQYKAV